MEKKLLVIIENKNNGILIVRLNRPHVLNALNINLLLKLKEVVNKIKKNRNIKIVIFTGSGKKAFSSGADLKERIKMNIKEVYNFIDLINKIFNMISNINVPTIAAINGIAFGGGLELALSCDIRVINEQSKIGLTECSLGVIPGAGGTQRLTKIVGLSVAKEMIFCSQKITAKEAYEIGLVNHVSPDEVKTRQKALNIAKKVIQNSSTSIQAAKKAIDLGYNINIRDALKIENNYYLKILSSKDRKEGLLAFKEKRIPVYN